MRKPTVITTPFPTPAQVAKELGIPPSRARQIQKMMDEIMYGLKPEPKERPKGTGKK